MTRWIVLLLVLCSTATLAFAPSSGPKTPRPLYPIPPPQIERYFSPKGGCLDAIRRELARATRTVHVQAYEFESATIASALLDAHRRPGVTVQAVLNISNETDERTQGAFLQGNGVQVLTDGEGSGINHNKVMIIDGQVVITGSYNFTDAAEQRNAENLLVIRSASVAHSYEEDFQRHVGHSTLFRYRGFSLNVTPTSRTVVRGTSATYTVSVASLIGFNELVRLSIAAVTPAGVTASFAPQSVMGAGSSTLTIATDALAPLGMITLTVRGTAGTITRTGTLMLTVTPS